MIPDVLAIAPYYADAFGYGKGPGRLHRFRGASSSARTSRCPTATCPPACSTRTSTSPSPTRRPSPSGLAVPGTRVPRPTRLPNFTTEPEYTDYNVNDRYTWVKCPTYNGNSMEATSLSRVLAAYKRNVPFIKEHVDAFLKALGHEGDLSVAQSTLGRTAIRQIETLYIATCMKEWVDELIEAVKSGDSEYFRAPETNTGDGSGFWEAPRGALYHSESVKDGKIQGYQIIIPSTWNLAPKNEKGQHGPLEEALIGVPVGDIEKPINALRTVHSFDPCTACSVHISEPATGKRFETVTSPWGVK